MDTVGTGLLSIVGRLSLCQRLCLVCYNRFGASSLSVASLGFSMRVRVQRSRNNCALKGGGEPGNEASLSVLLRLSASQSVHYQRLHCIPASVMYTCTQHHSRFVLYLFYCKGI